MIYALCLQASHICWASKSSRSSKKRTTNIIDVRHGFRRAGGVNTTEEAFEDQGNEQQVVGSTELYRAMATTTYSLAAANMSHRIQAGGWIVEVRYPLTHARKARPRKITVFGETAVVEPCLPALMHITYVQPERGEYNWVNRCINIQQKTASISFAS